MQKILETEYYTIETDAKKGLYVYSAKPSTVNLTDDLLYRESMVILTEFLKSGSEFAIANDKEFRYSISPEFQVKFNNEITIQLNKSKIRKFAHVRPIEFISKLSTEQLFEENVKRTYEQEFFPSMEEALEWLFTG